MRPFSLKSLNMDFAEKTGRQMNQTIYEKNSKRNGKNKSLIVGDFKAHKGIMVTAA